MRISWRWKKHPLPGNLSNALCNPFQAKNVAAGVSLLMNLLVYPGEPPSHAVPTMYVLAFQKRHIPALCLILSHDLPWDLARWDFYLLKTV